MIPLLRRYLLDHWTELSLGSPRPHELRFLVQATGISKLCCFIFPDDSPVPRWVAKLPRSPWDNSVLAREYEVIEYLRCNGSGLVRATIPGPRATATIAGHLVGLEDYLPGRPMDGLMMLGAERQDERGVRSYLDSALEWLLRCQQETTTPPVAIARQHVHTHFLEPLARLKATCQLMPDEVTYLDRVAARVSLLGQVPLPLVFKHGDFQPGNILVEGASIKVIDWEFGLPTAPPLLDVFGFLARTYARWYGQEEMDGYLEDYIEAFEAVFFEEGSFASRSAAYVERACAVLDIDPRWIDVLFALFLVTEANKYYALLAQRAARGYTYLLRSRTGAITGSYREQLARQKHVWLLGHLVQHTDRALFGLPNQDRAAIPRRPTIDREMQERASS